LEYGRFGDGASRRQVRPRSVAKRRTAVWTRLSFVRFIRTTRSRYGALGARHPSSTRSFGQVRDSSRASTAFMARETRWSRSWLGSADKDLSQ
jgi:hypothetical protein